MATLDQHSSASVVRLLNIGESKTGKTGSLASLAIAGYNLYILDYDNGLDILAAAIRHHYAKDDLGLAACMARVHYVTLRDDLAFMAGKPQIKAPVHAYKDAGKALAEWKATEFGPTDVLVIDTLTTLSDAAFNEALALGARLNQRPQLADYGWLADSVKLFIGMITDDDTMKCNVVVNSHIRYFGADDESGTQARGLPNARGQEISRIVSRYFNTIVLTRTQGQGAGAKRLISTKPQGVVEVATSNPFGVKDTYTVEGGLAPLFHDLLGHGPETVPAPVNSPAAVP